MFPGVRMDVAKNDSVVWWWWWGGADQDTRGLCCASCLFVLISPNLSESLPWGPLNIGSLSLILGGGRSERVFRVFRCGYGVLGLMYPVVHFLCPWREARMPLLAATDKGTGSAIP